MSVNQIVTPLDSAVLETKEQYRVYFEIVQHAFRQLVSKVAEEGICTELEATLIKQYCDLLVYSLEALRIKYLFNDEEKMRIDLTESGFPNFLEFRYLYNDLELKQEYLSKLPDISKLRAEFLHTLLREQQPIAHRKLQQAASLVYYSSVDQKFIYKRFVQGKIVELKAAQGPSYIVSWSFYDVNTNRPFISFMYFDLPKTRLEDCRTEIYEVLEQTADRDMDLDMMAYALDKKLPYLIPVSLKKIDLGPLHSVFARDELQVTHTLLKSIAAKALELPSYAISLSISEVTSSGNFEEGGFFSKQRLQVWDSPKPGNYLFSSHRVMQALYDEIPESLNALTREPIELPALKLQ